MKPPSQIHETRYCQPPDYDGRQWVILFDDPDQDILFFGNDEQGAKKAYEAACVGWNCMLLQTADKI